MSETHRTSEYGVMRQIMEDLGNGLSREEAAARLGASLASKGCRRKEQTYTCPICLDTGRLEIWSLYCVLDFVRDSVHPNDARHRVSIIACYCKAGECHVKRRLPRFDRDIHCPVEPIGGATGRTCNPKSVEKLLAWINAWQQRRPQPEVEDPLFHQGERS